MHRHKYGTSGVLIKENDLKWIKGNGDIQESSRSWCSEWNNHLKPWGYWGTLDRSKQLLNAGIFNVYFCCSWPWVFHFCFCLSLLKYNESVLYWRGKKESCFHLHQEKAIKNNSVIHCLMHQASDGNRDPPRDMIYDTLCYS